MKLTEQKIILGYISTVISCFILCSFYYQEPININKCSDITKEEINNKISNICNNYSKNKSKKKITLSNNGKEFIKKYEKLSLTSYRIKGETSNTIGWGHKINSDDPLWLRQKYLGYSISENQANEIFENDIQNKINPSLQNIYEELDSLGVSTFKLKSSFWDALGSLIYNCGTTGVKKSEFYKLLKRNRIKLAIQKIQETHVYLEGHKSRRSEEQEMMLKIYS